MSKLDVPPSEGGSTNKSFVAWQSFVQIVLEITIEAYQNMRKQGNIMREWEEDVFTLNLFKYMRPLASRHSSGINVKPQVFVFTPEMEEGKVPPNEAKKIDIQLWLGSWDNHDQIYFAWEAKLVVDRHIDEEHEYLVTNYISNGIIDRFIDESYSRDVDDAGMLGYILVGDITNIVDQINKSMQSPQRTRKLTASDYLSIASPIGSFTDIYRSSHKRAFCEKYIQLHHLFLTFDFDKGN